MKKLIIPMILALAVGTAWGQRGSSGSSPTTVPIVPDCTATSGSCPADGYFCMDSTNQTLHVCRIPEGWSKVRVGAINFGTTLPGSPKQGDIFIDTDATSGSQIYVAEVDGTWVLQAGGGGSGGSLSGLSDTTITSPANASVLIYDSAAAAWENKELSSDVTVSKEGAVTISADAVALSTDTTGTYIANSTTNGGLERSADVEGATLGIRTDCADNQIPKWNDGGSSWDCANDATGAGGQAVILDPGDGGANPSTDISEIASINDTDSSDCAVANDPGCIIREVSADKMQIDLSGNWPTADTATTAGALTANPTACTANQYVTDLDADGTLTCSQPSTFATPISSDASPQFIFKDTECTDTDVNASIFVECTNLLSTQEDCDVTVSQQIAGNSTNRLFIDADGDILIDGETDAIQLRIQGHTSQAQDTFVVEDSGGIDLLRVSETDGLVVGNLGAAGGAIEVIDTAALNDPTGGSTSIGTTAGDLVLKDTGATAKLISGISQAAVVIDPGAHYDVDTQVFLMSVDANNFPNGITVIEWEVNCNVAPDVEIDADLKHADAFIGLANATQMDAIDTTAGIGTDVAANMTLSTADAGDVLYLEFGSDPEGTCVQMIFEMWFRAEAS